MHVFILLLLMLITVSVGKLDFLLFCSKGYYNRKYYANPLLESKQPANIKFCYLGITSDV